MSEQLEPLATEAGQQAIVRAINNLSSLEYAVRAEHAATAAAQSADEALTSATNASNSETKARDWAEKTNGAVETETIVTPSETEGDPPTEELVSYFSAKYWAQVAEDYFNQMTFDTVPTEDSTNGITSGAVYDALSTKQDTLTFDNAPTQNSVNPVKSGGVYSALDTKADKSTTYTKTEVDTALSNVQSTLTFDNVPTANSDNPVKSSGIKTALDGKQDTLTFDSTPTANSTNPVTSGGVYTALQNVNIDIDDEITEDSDNPVTSAAIYEALQNFTPSGGGGGAGNASGMQITELYGGKATSGNVSLSDSIDNYDFLYFELNNPSNSDGRNYHTNIVDVIFLKNTNVNFPIELIGFDSRYVDLYYTSSTVLTIKETNTLCIRKIYGVNISKNLSEQMYSNVLWEKTDSSTTGNITLNDSIDNYDLIQFFTWRGSSEPYTNSFIILKDELKECTGTTARGKHFLMSGYDNRLVRCAYINNTTLNIYGIEGNEWVYKIVGIKLAKGGYSGIVSDARMTVKSGTVTTTNAVNSSTPFSTTVIFDSPMPDTNYEVFAISNGGASGSSGLLVTTGSKTVNGFNINAVKGASWDISSGVRIDWIAIRPNSYTREGMVEDVLFSNASGVNSGTINLSGNISDYDLIAFQLSYTSSLENYKTEVMPTSEIVDKTSSDGILFQMYSYENKYWCKIKYSSDSSLTIIPADISGIQENQKLKITKITGIKFGRYVSGVAVDTTVTQNSNAVVTSGAVYNALQNIPSGGGGGSYTLPIASENTLGGVKVGNNLTIDQNGILSATGGGDVFNLKTPLVDAYSVVDDGGDYYIATADKYILRYSNVYQTKYNNLPAIAGCFHYRDVGTGYRSTVLISTQEDAVKIQVNGGTVYSAEGSFIDGNTGITWYYLARRDGNVSWSNTPTEQNCPSINYAGLSSLNAAKALLSEANPQIAVAKIEENLFSPTNVSLSNGDTISNDNLKGLIAYHRPITVNNETYYPVKVDSGTYYYENPNNTITINSSWVATITAKCSGSVTVDSSITQNGTNPVEGGAIYTALGNKADTSTTYTKTEVDTALASKGDVTTDTDQNITGTKTFVGSKKVGFKQSTANDKLGFTLYGNTGTERGYLEFNPTNTVDGVTGLMTLGNYATSAESLTQVGFRRYSNISGQSGAYNLLMPMVADARTPFSLTTSYQNFYLPLGFTDGTTTVKTAKSGLVDLSPLLASLEARIAALEGN